MARTTTTGLLITDDSARKAKNTSTLLVNYRTRSKGTHHENYTCMSPQMMARLESELSM